jgi:hypothetical protein
LSDNNDNVTEEVIEIKPPPPPPPLVEEVPISTSVSEENNHILSFLSWFIGGLRRVYC